MGTEEDRRFMRRAIALAERGWGRVHPNPLVGAIIVRGDEVVGEGWHTAFGAPHAEVEALDGAGDAARGATAYVSLEPCAHHGKTPPCTDALVAAGVARVVFGAEDPTTEAGGGAERLRTAGVEVVGGVEREAVRRQNASFFHAAVHGRPWVALKYALSLDGGLARQVGERTLVTGAEAQADTHRLRAGHDAILVGSGTARVDDPLLTVRGAVDPIRPPLRVIVDTAARLAPTARVLQTVDEAVVVLLVSDDADASRTARLEEAGARVVPVTSGDGGLDLAAALDALWTLEVRSVLCEGGGRLGSALLRSRLASRLYVYYAPILLGRDAVPGFVDATLPGSARITDVTSLGADVRVTIELQSDGTAAGTTGAVRGA